LSELKNEQAVIIEALISAQKRAISSSSEEERAMRQRIFQLEQLLSEEIDSKDVLKNRNEELATVIEDSTLKLKRLESAESRAKSMENAVREAWDRVRFLENMMYDHQKESADISTKCIERQARIEMLDASLQVAEAINVANRESAVKEKSSFESIITQLRIDLNLSRESVDRARAQTDMMISQLSKTHSENAARAEAHAERMQTILTRTMDLETSMESQITGYLSIKSRLLESNNAAKLAESRSAAAVDALEGIKLEYATFQESSKLEGVRATEALEFAKIQMNTSSQATKVQLLALEKKDTHIVQQLERVEVILKEYIRENSFLELHASQLEAKLQEANIETAQLRKYLAQIEFSTKPQTENIHRITFDAAEPEAKQSNEKMINIPVLHVVHMQSADEIQSDENSRVKSLDPSNASLKRSPCHVRM
jgi:regulator of replication initiation timing